MKNQENKIEQTQSLLFEARALIKICSLAADSCITLALRENICLTTQFFLA
jgi:1,2-phenylacetyl-CoA epoxidase catalytic subunit